VNVSFDLTRPDASARIGWSDGAESYALDLNPDADDGCESVTIWADDLDDFRTLGNAIIAAVVKVQRKSAAPGQEGGGNCTCGHPSSLHAHAGLRACVALSDTVGPAGWYCTCRCYEPATEPHPAAPSANGEERDR
jgi:hypothetical protein